MKRVVTLFLSFLLVSSSVFGLEITSTSATNNANIEQTDNGALAKYRRSSLYSVLIKHSTYPYGEQIESAFMAIPVPDKFNDHNLDIRSFESTATKMKKNASKAQTDNMNDVNTFLSDNDIARKMISKWFNRNSENGGFDMSLIQERGFYDASQLDIANADASARGLAVLGDAGEDLIGKTFLIINDITFVDKGENSKKAAGVISVLGRLASAATGDATYSKAGDALASGVNMIDGFRVNITSYLYRLVWNEEVQGTFYTDYWFSNETEDIEKRQAYDSSDLFTVEYVGQTTTFAGNLALKNGKRSKESQMLTVCTRAVDNSIVLLQRSYEEFRVKVPIYRVNGDGTVEVQIGMKEGVNMNSQYEVLIPIEDENGHMSYKRVGMIRPIQGKIWDNRFGVMEDAKDLQEAIATGDKSAENAKMEDGSTISFESINLTSTTFEIINGENKITEGCLVREVTIKQ